MPFSAITGVLVERTRDPESHADDYSLSRLVLQTTDGPVPMTTVYANGSAPSRIAPQIRDILAASMPGHTIEMGDVRVK